MTIKKITATVEYINWKHLKKRAKRAASFPGTHTYYDPALCGDFVAFLASIGPAPDDSSLIRMINKRLGYVAGNLYWAHPDESLRQRLNDGRDGVNFCSDTPEYRLLVRLRRSRHAIQKNPDDSRIICIGDAVIASYESIVAAFGKAPTIHHRAYLKDKSAGWVPGNVVWKVGGKNSRFNDITGKKCGRYTVTGPREQRNQGTFWYCRCECGKEGYVKLSNLKRTDIKCKSCAARDRMKNPEHVKKRRQKKTGTPEK